MPLHIEPLTVEEAALVIATAATPMLERLALPADRDDARVIIARNMLSEDVVRDWMIAAAFRYRGAKDERLQHAEEVLLKHRAAQTAADAWLESLGSMQIR